MRLPLRSSLALSLFALASAAVGPVAHAEVHDIGPGDDLYTVLGGLSAGDEVIVQAGTYPTPGFLEVTWAGTAASPIVVRAAPGARPVLEGDPS
ncbi:MAG: hypothetical protein JRH11_05375 [Deltaproteobacteria bacterium]|nr:hypothetical protein [Deltaproteobacteria bacterium]